MEGAEPGWTVAEARMDTGRSRAGHWPDPGWTDSGWSRAGQTQAGARVDRQWPESLAGARVDTTGRWTPLAGAEQPGWPVAGAAERGADPELDTVAIF